MGVSTTQTRKALQYVRKMFSSSLVRYKRKTRPLITPAPPCDVPIGSKVVPFWDYLLGSQKMNHKKELIRGLW